MNDAFGVSVLQRVAKFRHQLHRMGRLKSLFFGDLSQVQAINEFHHQKVHSLTNTKIVNRDDIRMAQFAEGSCFAFESFREFGIVGSIEEYF